MRRALFLFNRPSAQVRHCRLIDLLDLNHHGAYVRGKIVAFLNDMIDMGVAGFRFDAAKHMYPGDIAVILNMTKNLSEDIRFDNVSYRTPAHIADFRAKPARL